MSKYDSNVQKLMIEFILSDSESFLRCQNILKVDYFDDQFKGIMRYILEYSDDYHTCPTFEQVNARSPLSYIKIANLNKVHCDALLDEVESFCRHKAIENEIFKAPDKIRRGEYADVEDAIRQAVLVSLQKDLGVNFFENPRSFLEDIRDSVPLVSTGWKTIDAKLYGGVAKGSLTIFAGGSGSGKSIFLQNITVNWASMKKNVIYFSFELSQDLVFHRISSMVSGIALSQVFKKIDEVDTVIKARTPAMGEIQIKYMKAGTTTNDLLAYINEYQIQTGIAVDAVVVDYLDLMHPNSNKVSPSDLFVKDKYVSEELRSLAMELNIVVCTASQLNRDSVDESEHTHAHIAGGISKINTADNVMTIHTSKARREAGEYQIQFLKTRSSSGVGQKINLEFNTETLRILDINFNAGPVRHQIKSEIASALADEKSVNNNDVDIKDSDDVYEMKKSLNKGNASDIHDLLKKVIKNNNKIRDS